jgi:hypothetical protein
MVIGRRSNVAVSLPNAKSYFPPTTAPNIKKDIG